MPASPVRPVVEDLRTHHSSLPRDVLHGCAAMANRPLSRMSVEGPMLGATFACGRLSK